LVTVKWSPTVDRLTKLRLDQGNEGEFERVQSRLKKKEKKTAENIVLQSGAHYPAIAQQQGAGFDIDKSIVSFTDSI